MKDEKTVTISVPEGYEIDKENSTFEKIVFRALPDKGLPKSWEELGEIRGYYVDAYTRVDELPFPSNPTRTVRNLFPTKAEAEASIALAQLCQLRDRYNGGWKPDWSRGTGMLKYCINIEYGEIKPNVWGSTQHVLAFKTMELRDEFMNNFADLIEKAKPLLG